MTLALGQFLPQLLWHWCCWEFLFWLFVSGNRVECVAVLVGPCLLVRHHRDGPTWTVCFVFCGIHSFSGHAGSVAGVGGRSPSSDMHRGATETSRDTSLIGTEFLESTLRILKVLELSFVPEGPWLLDYAQHLSGLDPNMCTAVSSFPSVFKGERYPTGTVYIQLTFQSSPFSVILAPQCLDICEYSSASLWLTVHLLFFLGEEIH